MAENGNGHSRLYRLEEVIEKLANSQRQLLTAQVPLSDHVSKIDQRMDRLVDVMGKLVEHNTMFDQKIQLLIEHEAKLDEKLDETTDKLNGLIGAVEAMRREFHERISRLENQ